MYNKMVENHELSIRDINSSILKMTVDLNVLITEQKHMKETIDKIFQFIDEMKEKNEEFYKKIDELELNRQQKASLFKAIRENITGIVAVMVPFLGIIGTILYEVGKYLRNLPVN